MIFNFIKAIFAVINLFVLFLIIKKLSIKFNVRINNFIYAYLGAICFITFKFMFLVVLRGLQIGKEINLKLELNKCIQILNEYFESPILRCLAILNIILIIIIYLKILKLLRWNFWKVCFYLIIFDFANNHKRFANAYACFKADYSYVRFCDKLTIYCNKILLKHLNKTLGRNFFIFGIRIILFLILLIIFVRECYLFNYTLKKTYYYLFIYIILQQWILFSLDIKTQSIIANMILFEQYYGFPNVIYINLNEKEKLVLETYSTNYKYDFELINKIHKENRYVQIITLNSTYYQNEDSGKKFFLEQLNKDSENLYSTK